MPDLQRLRAGAALLAPGRPHHAGSRRAACPRAEARHTPPRPPLPYLGFAETQWRLFDKERPPRVKPLLYTFRALLTGIHLMRTGEIEANLMTLNEMYTLPYIPELVARKLGGPEQGTPDANDVALLTAEYTRLRDELEAARHTTSLPEEPDGRNAVNDLLTRVRLETR